MPESIAIVNAGAIWTGDLASTSVEADGMRVVDGRIDHVGASADCRSGVDRVIDVEGATVAPGLIDSHCHVVLGDYTPRQSAVGFLGSYVHGGITQVVSPGEIHAPGRPRDRAGVKALAILAQRSWAVHRPGGMKVHGGSVVIEPVLEPDDFAELAREGVRLAKYGFGAYAAPEDGVLQVRAARAAGIKVTCHSGGASLPGSRPITTDTLMVLQPDIAGHINGGPTSLDDAGLARLVTETTMMLELVQAGCLRSAIYLVERIREAGAEWRVIIGSDTPTGTGTMPLGIIKTVAELSSLAGVEPATAWAWASGNTARLHGLDGGRIEPGRAADVVVCDAPWGSVARDATGALARGDIPGISAVLIDGQIRALRSRNTPLAMRMATVEPPMGELPGSAHVN